MAVQVVFRNRFLPYLLVAPQAAVTLVFFFWPAAQGMRQSLLREDAFGLSTEFVGLDNYVEALTDPRYLDTFLRSVAMSALVAFLSMSTALLLAAMADRAVRGGRAYRTLLIWPYAVAPALAGVLWFLMFNPTIGVVGVGLNRMGIAWNPYLDGAQAFVLVTVAASWKQVSYNFVFFLAGLQAIPAALIEAAAIDGASPFRRFWTIVFPLLAPTSFFLLVVNVVYAFFETFAVIHATTQGGPGGATETLVYKVFNDGFIGLDLGGSAAQSAVLMAIVAALTVAQFRLLDRKAGA
ncbi:sn-glycerol-3-phosphate ABC transporter permease UgpA [Oleispirillum naphthae]|uniref:sn-glycerol-3-phosphate ABC transporter permease UgpA n=1 Tax=Oleispirillum naphthae TaxID=2838853 RepID=UPI0030824751